MADGQWGRVWAGIPVRVAAGAYPGTGLVHGTYNVKRDDAGLLLSAYQLAIAQTAIPFLRTDRVRTRPGPWI